MNCWSSASSATAFTSFGFRLAWKNTLFTQRGRNSKRILISSPELMVRPKAGKPTSKRAVMPAFVISHAVRERISGPGLLMAIRPLLPDPLALKLNWAISRPNCRTR